jgi:hypothetical protein
MIRVKTKCNKTKVAPSVEYMRLPRPGAHPDQSLVPMESNFLVQHAFNVHEVEETAEEAPALTLDIALKF